MPYEFYKVAHIALLLIFAASFAGNLGRDRYHKGLSIVAMVSSLLMFVAGFGLLARLQIWNWPSWVMIKMAIWLLLSISAPILVKRAGSKKSLIAIVWFGLALVAVISAVYKP